MLGGKLKQDLYNAVMSNDLTAWTRALDQLPNLRVHSFSLARAVVLANNTSFIQALLARDLDPNARSTKSGTPLLSIMMRDSFSHPNVKMATVTMLIKSGADVDAVDHKGRTPMHHAFEHDLTESMKMLISYGANLKFSDDVGFHLATRNSLESVEILAESDANFCIECPTAAVSYYLSITMPSRIRRCKQSVLALLLYSRHIRTIYGPLDKNIWKCIGQFIWASRRLPVWEEQQKHKKRAI